MELFLATHAGLSLDVASLSSSGTILKYDLISKNKGFSGAYLAMAVARSAHITGQTASCVATAGVWRLG